MTPFSDQNVATLFDLGLTGSQARTYLTLLTIGTASVREASKASGISRPDVYRAIISLEQIGLLERVITTPTKYKPLPVFEALSILLGRKEKEDIELQSKVAKLYEEYKQNCSIQLAGDDEHQYIMIPEGKAFSIKLKKMIEKAEKDVCVEFSQKKLLPWLLNDDTVEKTAKRGVDVKVLAEKNPPLRVPKSILDLGRKHAFEIRYIAAPSSVSFVICDHKEALVPVVSDDEDAEPSAVWSNNSSFIELAQNYFDDRWFGASQLPEYFDYLFSEMLGGFSYNQIILGSGGNRAGYMMLTANGAFLKTFDLAEENFGKEAAEPFPGAEKEPILTRALGQVASGKIARFEYSMRIGERWYSLLVFSPKRGYFILVVKEK